MFGREQCDGAALAVAADDVCTIADRAYRYVPRGGFVSAITAENSKLSYSRFCISTRQSTSSAAAGLMTSLYMEVVDQFINAYLIRSRHMAL